MDDSTLIQLKILVERVVRPVRTASTRKLKMREELLTHVIAAYEEEAARLVSQQEALIRTAQRFGNTAELTRQFQESIPKPDWQMWSEQLVGFPEGKSIRRRVARHSMVMCLLWLPLIPIFIFQGRTREWPIAFWMPICAALYTLLIHWLREPLFLSAKRQWHVVTVVLVISALAMPAITFVICLTISRSLLTSWNMAAPLIPQTTVLAPIALAVCAYGTAVEIRRMREWEALAI